MKVSGFTIIRNGTRFDYPYLESINSLLPLVDELIINVGKGDDDTLLKIENLSKNEGKDKLKFFESTWPMNDPEKTKGGIILSEQTNLAFDKCTGDWCFYLQSDEVIHEDDYEKIKTAMHASLKDNSIDGLLFDYRHFYGSYDVIQETRSSYRREVRAIKRSSGARSVGDAQSFRKTNNEKLNVLHCGARIFHYGWVRPPEKMREKTFFMDQLYHGSPDKIAKEQMIPFTGENYRYKRFWGLKPYRGTHPKIIQNRIREKGWKWDLENSPFVWELGDLKKIISDIFEKLTGVRLFEYRSYRLK